jgi:UDP-N-acetylglucosamine 2-epimerase (non-hydrolysing)
MLVGTDKEQIIDDASRLIGDRDLYRAMATSPSPYGDGKASKYIVKEILEDG